MPVLTPTRAADIANGVYFLRTQSVSQAHDADQQLGCEDIFTVGDPSRFTGSSGGLVFWHPISGFGYVAAGKGLFQGDVLIACRGTDVVADWLTDGNFAMHSGPTGSSVHAGFQNTFASFVNQLDTALATLTRGRMVGTVHCVGHSLGGALATLAAAHCHQRGIGRPELYTFGSPRVGGGRFSSDLTDRLGSNHIHRVFHFADPVPMVPLWPFMHVPYGGAGNVIGGNRTSLISFGAHSMKSSYLQAVAGLGWNNVSATTNNRTAGQVAEAWLKDVANGREAVVPMGAFAFDMLGRALRWLVDQSLDLFVAVAGPVALGALTLLDELAIMLERAAQLTEKMSMYVTTLVGAILRFAGLAAHKGLALTRSFIRWALQLLFTPIRLMAKAASMRPF